MTRIAAVLLVAVCLSCGAVQSQHSESTGISGSNFDVDINGRFFVIDDTKNVLRLYAKDQVRQKEIGGPGWGDGQFDRPAGIWARNGIDVFVADYGNHRIQRFDRNLAFISSFSTRDRPNPNERFGYPTDVAVSRLGDLFICDGENSRILKVVGLSQIERTFGGFDAGKGRLRKPVRLEIGPQDNVYVQDGSRVVVFDTFGNFVRIIGDGVFQGMVQISSDESGLVVMDETKLFFFDGDDRLVLDVPIASLLPAPRSTIRAFAFSRGVGYFLTEKGMITVRDQREKASDENNN